jgi:hypothetical protein
MSRCIPSLVFPGQTLSVEAEANLAALDDLPNGQLEQVTFQHTMFRGVVWLVMSEGPSMSTPGKQSFRGHADRPVPWSGMICYPSGVCLLVGPCRQCRTSR